MRVAAVVQARAGQSDGPVRTDLAAREAQVHRRGGPVLVPHPVLEAGVAGGQERVRAQLAAELHGAALRRAAESPRQEWATDLAVVSKGETVFLPFSIK